MLVRNKTPFVAAWTVLLDKTGAEQLIPCVRGTWSLSEDGQLTLIEKDPPPLLVTAEYAGEPGLSSIIHEADVGPFKPATDCALVGSAVAPRGRRATRVEVSFRVGPVSRQAVVTGECERQFRFLRWSHSSPKPFRRVPLLWELAAGGADTSPEDEKNHSRDENNPYGRGFRARGSRLPGSGALLPQITGAPEPAGFGLTGNEFRHRRPYAGTYDQAWQDHRAPLLPDDFDERFHCAAAPGLTTRRPLKGGESVEVLGCTPDGRLAFTLPVLQPTVIADLGDGDEPIAMFLQTVTVNVDLMQLRMLWRGTLKIHGRLPRFQRLNVKLAGPSG